VNELVRQLNTLGTNAINIAVYGVSPEDERGKLRERLARRAEEAARAAAPVPRARPQFRPSPAALLECATARCKTRNPSTARFCRRCGKVLPAA
jgi:hypothetical protein